VNTEVHLPAGKSDLLVEVVQRLSGVPDVVAVVLGGSHACGTADPSSDLDIGVYYREAEPFDVRIIAQVAAELAVDHGFVSDPVVTDFYEWGPWVNGGAWIHTAAGKVDFLYRNLNQIERTIDDAQQGRVQQDYGQQPPFGFYSVMHLAETTVAVVLHDPAGEIRRLKERVREYPPELKAAIVTDSLWSAEFSLRFAESSASRGEVYATVGCITRALAALTQALFAINERYFLTEKRLDAVLATFTCLPSHYSDRVATILSRPGDDALSLEQTVHDLADVWRDVVALTNGAYEPKYSL